MSGPQTTAQRPGEAPQRGCDEVPKGRWTREREEDRALLEQLLRQAARHVHRLLPRRFGFLVVLFEYGDDARVVHLTTAGRRAIARVLREVRLQLERRR